MPDGFDDFPTPWEIYPQIPCGSIHWRMGPGEDAMLKWGSQFGGLTQEQRLNYREMHPGPPEWVQWLNRVIESLPRERDRAEIGNIIRKEVDEVFLGFTFQDADTVEVKTARKRLGPPEGGHIFKVKRMKQGWTIQKDLTESWSA